MNSNSDRIIELLTLAVAKATPEERNRFLDGTCQGDPELREQVLSFLRA